ncbi:DUF2339 domain-containing protein [Niveibacterium sp.]|uniref:DUF2339 domain-containing protein n=1 Tax=Niveibacterium sp. TaxID=2017444 RepID=UPI0035AD9C0D
MSVLLMLIGLVLGLVAALANDLSGWLGAALGGLIGFLAGRVVSLTQRLEVLVEQLEASEQAQAALREHFDRVTLAIHQRFVALESRKDASAEAEAPAAPAESAVSAATHTAERTTEDASEQTPALTLDVIAEPVAAVIAPEAASISEPAQAVETAPAEQAHSEPATAAPSQPTPAWAPEVPEAAAHATPPNETAEEALTEPAGPNLIERAFDAARAWLFGGNTLVRMGIVLLFLGLAFLLRYAAERTTLPIEFRYAGVAATALGLLVIGWRLRARNGPYGLLLQGAAVAVMYLTTFAAMRLHPLIPMQGGFALMVAIAVLAGLLAVKQDAASLAIAGTLGGFAAPILASTGGGSHVALFSYFLLLNAGVLGIAWFKAWRVLNLVGFAGTFLIGTAWGLRSYQPELFASTEPFLVAFFLMYVTIALLFARRRMAEWVSPTGDGGDRGALLRGALAHANAIDGTLLFGVPLVGFGLQVAVIRHIEYGMAFSAFALGAFYLILARALLGRDRIRNLLLVEVFLALGVIFASLAIPLALDDQWTAAAWAVEGAGIYWLGHRQQRTLARAFALLLQAGATVFFLRTLSGGTSDPGPVLTGSWLGTLMLAGALLSNWRVARMAAAQNNPPADAVLKPLFAVLGLVFAYLLAPMLAGSTTTAVAWAIAGVATVWAALRFADRAALLTGMLVQVAAGIVFFANNHGAATDGAQVFAAGLSGLVVCGLIGLTVLASTILATRHADALPGLSAGVGLFLVFGLALINLAVLFVLPWRVASGVWALSGVLILWLAVSLRQAVAMWFGIALQVAAAAAFLLQVWPHVALHTDPDLSPLRHAGFLVPLVIALAAWVAAWRLQQRGDEQFADIAPKLSLLGLLWGALWWGHAWLGEITRFLAPTQHHAATLGLIAATAILWTLAARRWVWATLANLCLALTPFGWLALAAAYHGTYAPFSNLASAGWAAMLLAHLLALRLLGEGDDAPWPAIGIRFAHALGAWLLLTVLALAARALFAELGDERSAWRWLGWALVPAAYLVLTARENWPQRWPFGAHETTYRTLVATPVALLMMLWVMAANLHSTGSAAPLPYLPLANPLEIACGIVLIAVWRWLARVELADDVQQLLRPSFGALAFLVYTCGVARAVHHWAGVPFESQALFASMTLQASLSIAWSIAALALMVSGHRAQHRLRWLIGAVLIGVVVAKLFLIELSNTGGLARIVSFIAVGVLLLVVGYFAPLPPKQNDQQEGAGS